MGVGLGSKVGIPVLDEAACRRDGRVGDEYAGERADVRMYPSGVVGPDGESSLSANLDGIVLLSALIGLR